MSFKLCGVYNIRVFAKTVGTFICTYKAVYWGVRGIYTYNPSKSPLIWSRSGTYYSASEYILTTRQLCCSLFEGVWRFQNKKWRGLAHVQTAVQLDFIQSSQVCKLLLRWNYKRPYPLIPVTVNIRFRVTYELWCDIQNSFFHFSKWVNKFPDI